MKYTTLIAIVFTFGWSGFLFGANAVGPGLAFTACGVVALVAWIQTDRREWEE